MSMSFVVRHSTVLGFFRDYQPAHLNHDVLLHGRRDKATEPPPEFERRCAMRRARRSSSIAIRPCGAAQASTAISPLPEPYAHALSSLAKSAAGIGSKPGRADASKMGCEPVADGSAVHSWSTALELRAPPIVLMAAVSAPPTANGIIGPASARTNLALTAVCVVL